jgi:hypothetical protein
METTFSIACSFVKINHTHILEMYTLAVAGVVWGWPGRMAGDGWAAVAEAGRAEMAREAVAEAGTVGAAGVVGGGGGGGGGGGVAEAGLAGAAGLVVEMVVGGAGDWHDVCLRSEEKNDD